MKPLQRATAQAAENSIFRFNGSLTQVGLRDVATGAAVPTPLEDEMLARMVLRWVADDESVMTALRNEFGDHAGGGMEMLNYIKANYIRTIVKDASDAEHELNVFDWAKPFGKTSIEMKVELDSLKDIIGRLPPSRRGDPHYWIGYITDRIPEDLAAELDRYLRGQSVVQQQRAASSVAELMVMLGKALDKKNKRAGVETKLCQWKKDMGINAHEEKGRDGKERKKCPECELIWCPKAKDLSRDCDVYKDPSPGRAATIQTYPNYQRKVDALRQKLGKKPIVYAEAAPAVNVHSVIAAADRAHGFDANTDDEESDLDTVLNEMESRWAQSDMQLEMTSLVQDCAGCIRH